MTNEHDMSELRVIPPEPHGPHPKVSVIVTTYNHERFIAEALDGALGQRTSFPFEVVVGEDCSTDRTRSIVEAYQQRHPDTIRLVLPNVNLGPNRMYLEVMREARGDYFAILDGDDYWSSTDKLERQAQLLDADPNCVVCFHDVTAKDELVGASRALLPERKDQYDFRDMLVNFVPTSSIMHRRIDTGDLERWLQQLWGSSWETFLLIDWVTLLFLAKGGSSRRIDDVDAVYRVHEGGVWSSRSRQQQISEEIKVLTVLEELGHRYVETVRQNLLRCHVHLAVEHIGLPYRGLVVVVGDSPATPWYFNGRATWQIAGGKQPEDAAALKELQRLQRLDPPTATPHWGTSTPIANVDTDCLYVVVPSPRDRFERFPRLMRYTRQHHCLHADDDCEIYQLEVTRVRERRVLAVERTVDDSLRGHLDRPLVGTVTSGATTEIIGWALPRAGRVREVRICHGEEVLQRVMLGVERPDLAAAFPHQPDACTAGFRTLVDLAGVPAEARVDVRALLGDERQHVLASLITTAVPGCGSHG